MKLNKKYLSPEGNVATTKSVELVSAMLPSGNHRMRSQKGARIAGNVVVQTILTIMAIIWVIPFAYIVLHSFRGNNIGIQFPSTFLPTEFTLVHYEKMLGGTPEIYNNADFSWINFPKWWINTLFVAICSCLIATAYTLFTSYVLSRMRFKLRKPIMRLVLILGMFPGFLGNIAVYQLMVAIGFDDGILKLVTLILVYSGGAGMGYYICKGFFDTIPRALDESARIDGANRAQVFWHIILPASKPIIVYTVLTAFMAPWMDFILCKIIIMGEDQLFTVSLGLHSMITREGFANNWLLFCAGATLVALPISLLFMFLQRYYVSGVTGGAVKG